MNTHRKQTVGLRCMQSKLSRRKLILFNFDGQMLGRLLLQIRPVTEKRHSTGTDPADMPLIKQYVQQVAVTFLTKVDWQNILLLNSVQTLAETNRAYPSISILSICSSVLAFLTQTAKN